MAAVSNSADASAAQQVGETKTAELQESFNATTSFVGAAYPSTPVTLVNIPEVVKAEAKFVYNYYVRDERTNSNGNLGVVDMSNPGQEAQGIAKSENLPRYNRLSITAPTFQNEDKMLKGIAERMGEKIVEDNLNYLQFESAISSARFSGIRLQDNQVDQSFYYALSSSISFFGEDSVTSGNQQSEILATHVSSSQAFGPSGQNIRDALSNLQAQGVSYAPTDVRNEVASDAFRSVRFINFNMNINNLLVSNMVQGALTDKTNIYEDEIESMEAAAISIQEGAVVAATPGIVQEDEYNIPVVSIDSFSTSDETVSSSGPYNEGSYPIGYYIEKFEIVKKDDQGNYDRVVHDPLIVNSFGDLNLKDSSVKYGGTYIYNIRTVALTRFEAFRTDATGDTSDEVVVAIVMIASKGVMVRVQCTENIPPEPPGNISFKYDYANDNLMIFWEEPLNPQRDVVRYQILRRKSTDVPFTLLRELDFDKSTSKVQPVEKAPDNLILSVGGARKFYRDEEFGKESKYIYSICCVDARGFTSNYSAQFKVSFDRMRNKIVLELVSKKGAPKPYPNIYLNQDLFVDTMKDSGHSRMRLFFDPEYFDVYKTMSESKDVYYDGDLIRTTKQTESLNLIGNNYKLQIINVDNQMSQLVDIKVKDLTGPPLDVPVSEANLSSIASLIQSELNTT